MRMLLSLLALSSCLLLTMAQGTGVARIDAHALRIEGLRIEGATLPKVAVDFTRRPSGAATRSSG